MPKYKCISYKQEGQLVYITLNRPDVLNALNDEMQLELNEAWQNFDSETTAHVAILSGAGRAFCAGADIKQRQMRPREDLERLGGPIGRNAAPLRFEESINYKPVIAAIHGFALGAGWSQLAEPCDLIVAARDTRIQLMEVRRGLGGADLAVGAWFYSGSRFANEISITGREFGAEEAFEHGLINKVVPQSQLLEVAENLAGEILKNPPLAVRATVQGIRHLRNDLGRAAGLYQRGMKLYLTDDFREAAQSFLERRNPIFKGQ